MILALGPPSVCGGVPDSMACTDLQCYCLDGKQLVITAGTANTVLSIRFAKHG